MTARGEVFEQLNQQAKKILIISEGLITYLSRDEVAGLARDLAVPASFRSWILDMPSPALLRRLLQRMGSNLKTIAPFKFAPEEGPNFFVPYGWIPKDVRSVLKVAAQIKRLPLYLRPFSWLPDKEATRSSRPWSGVCLFTKR